MAVLIIGGQKAGEHTWNDFEVVDELASGSFGRILLMRLKKTGELFIIKRLPYVNASKKKMAEEEVEMLILARSEYTSHFIEWFLFDVDLCIVLEYYPNKSLRDLMNNELKDLPMKEKKMIAYKYCYQVLKGLNVLHKQKIVHRDLKPENVLIDNNKNAKLADFGLASKMASRSNIYAAGTLNYISPEGHTTNKMTDKSDVWSLGVIMIEIVSGVHPFLGKSIDETISNIKLGKMNPIPNDIQGDLKQMIIWMLAQDPNKRPSAEELLESDLMQLVAKIGQENESQIREIETEKQKAIELMQKEKKRADLAITEKDKEKRRADSSQELVRIFQQQVETTQSEVTRLTTDNNRLTAEVTRLNQELSRRETVPATPKAQPKQTPIPTPKPKQEMLQVNLNVPNGMNGHKEQSRFIHDNSNKCCTISTEPVISEGIVYFESVFEKCDRKYFAIGIVDSSVVFQPDKGPWDDGNNLKTVIYFNTGLLFHINQGPYNQEFKSGERIGAEVNMSSNPRRLTFFVKDVEQKNYVINIPQAIRFWAYISKPNSSFTVNKFERRSSSSAHGVEGSKALEWGQRWPEE